MDHDSKLLYQFTYQIFQRLKAIQHTDTHNVIELERFESVKPIYEEILRTAPSYLLKNNRQIPFFYYFYGSTMYYLNRQSNNRELLENSIRLIKKAMESEAFNMFN